MKQFLLCLALLGLSVTFSAQAKPLNVAVVGGIPLCGVWQRLVPRIERATGIKLRTVSFAPKAKIIPDFSDGTADLLLIHGGAETFALQASGIGGQQRVWAFNEHVLLGPPEDPADLRHAQNGAEALAHIAATPAPFVAFRDPGSHEIVQRLLKKAHVRPTNDWMLLDDSEYSQEVVKLAAAKHAYVVVGAIPVAFEKLQTAGLEVLLHGDPEMRKAYVVMEPGPRHPANRRARQAARRVADFLTSAAGQAALAQADHEAGGPWIYPMRQP